MPTIALLQNRNGLCHSSSHRAASLYFLQDLENKGSSFGVLGLETTRKVLILEQGLILDVHLIIESHRRSWNVMEGGGL